MSLERKSHAILAVSAAALAALLPGSGHAQRVIEDGRPASPNGTVKITNLAGSVRVEGWARDSLALSGTLGPEIEIVQVSGDGRSTRVRVVIQDEHRREALSGTDLVVRVPASSHVAVRTAKGEIEVSGVQGAVDLETVDGDVVVSGPGLRSIHVFAGGDVTIEAATKILRARSLGGSLTVRHAMGYLDVSTVAGRIVLNGRHVWEGRASSVSGDILFSGSFDPNGSFVFESNSGDIELALAHGTDADFDVVTYSGRLEHELALGSGPEESVSGQRREVLFSVGDSGTLIKIQTYKGNVRLRESS